MRIRALAAVLGVLALSGCVSTPAPSASAPRTPASASPSPTATSVPTAISTPAVNELRVTSQGLVLVEEDGEILETYGYLEPVSEVVAGLEDRLGTPVEQRFPETLESGEGTLYSWDGLTVRAQDRWAEIPTAELPEFQSRWSVAVTRASAAGVLVATVYGYRIGTATAEIEQAHPDAVERLEMSSVTPRVDIYLDSTPPADGAGREPEAGLSWRVWLFDEEPDDVIQEIRAPSPNYGA